jgi:hypothetical protein
METEEALLFFVKKARAAGAAKNSHSLGVVAPAAQTPHVAKVFCIFFSKKKVFLSTKSARPPFNL